VVGALTRIASAQMVGITLPEASPAAELKQRIGMTDVTVVYHRPAVNKRTVWGELVPWSTIGQTNWILAGHEGSRRWALASEWALARARLVNR
jgi:hypothetical protein